MAVKKITISLDAELADEIRRDAEASSSTVSAWIAEAAEEELRHRRAVEALRAYEAECGPIPESHIQAVEEQWQELLLTPEPSSPQTEMTGSSGAPGRGSSASAAR